jgi:hypothetical protein
VFLMFVTGGPPVRGGGGIPQRIIVNSRSPPALRTTGGRIIGKDPGHRLQVADVAIYHSEQSNNGGLVCGDQVSPRIEL